MSGFRLLLLICLVFVRDASGQACGECADGSSCPISEKWGSAAMTPAPATGSSKDLPAAVADVLDLPQPASVKTRQPYHRL